MRFFLNKCAFKQRFCRALGSDAGQGPTWRLYVQGTGTVADDTKQLCAPQLRGCPGRFL